MTFTTSSPLSALSGDSDEAIRDAWFFMELYFDSKSISL
jgi:hypothetical protein